MTGPLVAVATVAITAATWHSTTRDSFAGAADVDRILGTESEPTDIQLRSGSSPFFTTTGALATVETGWHGEAAVPIAVLAGGGAGLTHRAWTGFTGSGTFDSGSGASRPHNGASTGRSSFGRAISGMSMSGGWGGVSGSAGNTGAAAVFDGVDGKASPASSAVQRATGGAPSAQRAASSPSHVTATEAASHDVATVAGVDAAAPDAAHAIAPAAAPAAGLVVFHEAAGAGAPGVVGGAVHQQAAPHPSPAATPEPVTMVLVGIGAVALYRLRRYLV